MRALSKPTAAPRLPQHMAPPYFSGMAFATRRMRRLLAHGPLVFEQLAGSGPVPFGWSGWRGGLRLWQGALRQRALRKAAPCPAGEQVVRVSTPGEATSFLREVAALSEVKHPNVMPFYGAVKSVPSL